MFSRKELSQEQALLKEASVYFLCSDRSFLIHVFGLICSKFISLVVQCHFLDRISFYTQSFRNVAVFSLLDKIQVNIS
uniref:Uncharacterized protein n=1 Tax=Anguilla anguilla TaxID=7936 RepID=A0A0E9RZU3_ANGAN